MSESVLEDFNDINTKKVIEELSLYTVRKIDIEDMKLKIEELKVCDSLGSLSYEERVQTSMKCKNNDSILEEIERLEKRIKLFEIKNKRVDNSLQILSEEEREVIIKLYINKISRTQASKELYKSRKSIKHIEGKAIVKLKLA